MEENPLTKFEIRVRTGSGELRDHLKNVSSEVLDRAIDLVETTAKNKQVQIEYRQQTRKGAKDREWVTV